MAARDGYIKVEGLKEFQRAVRRAEDHKLGKRLGQANKEIGKLVIARLRPAPTAAAVGQGAGASVRPSATKREVLLRVGGKHRAGKSPQMQWGRRPGRRVGSSAPDRPYIQQTAQDNYDEITNAWLEAISDAMDSAFWRTDP